MKLANHKIWLLVSLLAAGVLLLMFVFLLNNRTFRYDFPDGFHGWVVIQYGDPQCPELEKKEGHWNLQIPASGCLCTATPIPEGFTRNVFQYVTSDGRRTPIPEKYADRDSQIWEHVTGGKTLTREFFFVGTHDQYKQAPKLPYISQHHCKELDRNPES